jgi:hypothetical protein
MLYIVPGLGLTVAMTSDESLPSTGNGHLEALHGLMAEIITAVRADAAERVIAAPHGPELPHKSAALRLKAASAPIIPQIVR